MGCADGIYASPGVEGGIYKYVHYFVGTYVRAKIVGYVPFIYVDFQGCMYSQIPGLPACLPACLSTSVG